MARFDRQFIGSPNRADARRRAELAKIHLLAQELGFDDDLYRDVLEQVSGQRSAAALDAAARQRVIAHFNAKLGRNSSGGTHRAEAPNTFGRKPMLRKIEALLSDGGKPWRYAEALALRICKKERLEFCSDGDLRKIIAALSYDQRRHAGATHD